MLFSCDIVVGQEDGNRHAKHNKGLIAVNVLWREGN